MTTGKDSSVVDRSDIISFFQNTSDVDMRILFGIIHEIRGCIIYESRDEEEIFDLFSTLLWKITAGADMVLDGKNRKIEDDTQ